MLDEEKKAIKKVKYICDKWYDENLEIDVKWLESLLSLCEKQQKEIEELEKNRKVSQNFAKIVATDYISKDKLKEILGIEEETDSEKILSLLQTIVDENARLEDIEDKKVQIEYNNVFNKGVKSVEDKIKVKIEELDNNISHIWVSTNYDENLVTEKQKQIEVLQSLLEEK